MKKCPKCREEKVRELFGPHKARHDGLQAICIECRKRQYKENPQPYKDRKKKRRQGIKSWLVEYKKTLKCQLCSESESVCLDFHHLRDKEGEISQVIHNKGWSIERVKKEIHKCVPLCANCHRKVHSGILSLTDL